MCKYMQMCHCAKRNKLSPIKVDDWPLDGRTLSEVNWTRCKFLTVAIRIVQWVSVVLSIAWFILHSLMWNTQCTHCAICKCNAQCYKFLRYSKCYFPWLKSGFRDSSVTGQVHIKYQCISGAYSFMPRCISYYHHCRLLWTITIIILMTITMILAMTIYCSVVR